MRFNTFINRLFITTVLALPSYTFLYLIRGYDFSEMTAYSHVEYSAMVFLILFLLFEVHTIKSNWLEHKLPWEGSVKNRLWAEGVLTLLFTPAIVTCFVFILYRFIWNMQVWWPGVFEYNLFALSFSLFIAGFVNADVIIDKWKHSLLKNEQLEKENIKARLKTLQAQISPHFLFNNFNVLNALIDDNPALARKYLDKLSEVYRYVLNRKEEELVPLSDEVHFIKDYLFLLNIRFNNKINCSIALNGHSAFKLPPATLQILIENVIKHNEVSGRKPLNITISTADNEFLKVENQLQPKHGTPKGAGVGLKNIKDRYKYLTDKPVTISKSATDFTVTVPLLNY